jgi:hypothetical protein
MEPQYAVRNKRRKTASATYDCCEKLLFCEVMQYNRFYTCCIRHGRIVYDRDLFIKSAIKSADTRYCRLHAKQESRDSGWMTDVSEFESRQGHDFSLLHVVQTGSSTHPTSYPMGDGVKAAGALN